MDSRNEIRGLVAQAVEYLRYYREIGLTHIGEESAPERVNTTQMNVPQPAELPVSNVAVKREPATAPAVVTPKTEEPFISTPVHPPAFTSKSTQTMSTKKDAPLLFDTPSLFGDSAPQTPEASSVQETLEEIRADLGDCKRCKLWTTRTNIVFGEGNPNAELMFVGEGPGADEDASGRPFVGRAGQLLTKMIEAINYKREDVYIANVVKSRPPGNRNPETDEVKACSPFLFRQIAAIRPKLIVTLGNPATQALLDTKIGITRLRGEFQDYPRNPNIKVVPTFHPAYLLRSPDKKREAWEDLKKVRAFLRGEIDL